MSPRTAWQYRTQLGWSNRSNHRRWITFLSSSLFSDWHCHRPAVQGPRPRLEGHRASSKRRQLNWSGSGLAWQSRMLHSSLHLCAFLFPDWSNSFGPCAIASPWRSVYVPYQLVYLWLFNRKASVMVVKTSQPRGESLTRESMSQLNEQRFQSQGERLETRLDCDCACNWLRACAKI